MPDVTNGQSKDGEGSRPRDGNGERLVPAEEVSQIVSRRVKEVEERNARDRAELQKQIDALKTQQPAPPPKKTYSREQLTEAVEKGVMTQKQANAVWDRQHADLTKQSAADTAIAVVRQEQREKDLAERIEKYAAHDPDLAVEGSDARTRIAAEVNRQINEFGLQGLSAEYAALRVVYGEHDKLHKGRERGRTAHMDLMGGGSGNADDGSEPGDIKVTAGGDIKGLTPTERNHYQKLIDRGVYADWKAVAEEMKFANPRLRQRVAARR